MDCIVELRAGLMALQGGRLTADSRKGLLRVCQDDAGLTHLCWCERDAAGAAVGGEPEKDIVIIPGECTFGKITRPGSRIFELRFPQEKQRNMFFWAQDPDASTDDDYVAAFNLALNMAEGEEEEEGGVAAMETEAAAPAAAAGSAGIGAADLAAVLGNILSGGIAGGGASLQQRRLQHALDVGPGLGAVLSSEALAPLLRSDPELVARLAPYLPEEHRSAEAVVGLVSTPQFRHQLDLLTHALQTGQLDTRQFGLPPGGFGVADFLKSIQAHADSERQKQQGQQGGDGAGAAQ